MKGDILLLPNDLTSLYLAICNLSIVVRRLAYLFENFGHDHLLATNPNYISIDSLLKALRNGKCQE